MAKPRETDAQREFRYALEWMAADPRGRLLLNRWLAPIFTPTDFQGDRQVFEAGRLAHAHSIMGAFAAQAPESLVLLLTEKFREQDPRGRRADTDPSSDRDAGIPADFPELAQRIWRGEADTG